MALLGVAAFLVLAGRLVKLMLVDHDYYEAKAISNQTRSTRVTASRGAVYDRNMELLAASSSVETIFLDPLQLRQNGVDLDLLAKNLAPILDISEDFIKSRLPTRRCAIRCSSGGRGWRSAIRFAPFE